MATDNLKGLLGLEEKEDKKKPKEEEVILIASELQPQECPMILPYEELGTPEYDDMVDYYKTSVTPATLKRILAWD